MIKDQSKILIAMLPNRGRRREVCRSENGNVSIANSVCGVEKEGFLMSLKSLRRMVVSLNKLRNKAFRTGVCGGEYGFYFPCEEFKALWESWVEMLSRKLDSRVWSLGKSSVLGSFVNHERTGKRGHLQLWRVYYQLNVALSPDFERRGQGMAEGAPKIPLFPASLCFNFPSCHCFAFVLL